MVARLVNIGIFLIPFYEVIIRLFPYVDSLAPDTRVAKASIAMTLAVLIFLVQVQDGIRFKNKFALCLIGYIFLTNHMWWHMPFQLNGINMPSFWKWQPLLTCLVFALFTMAVASYKWTQVELEKIYKSLCIAAMIMAVYMILQRLGLDPFYSVLPVDKIGSVTAPHVAGTLGQPTLAAPFLVVCLPFVSKLWKKAVVFAAILCSQSVVAIAVAILVLLFLLSEHFGVHKAYVIAVATAVSVSLFAFKDTRAFLLNESNGRGYVWSETIKDISTTPFEVTDGKKYALFGVGIGVFDKVFHVKHKLSVGFNQVHNEYLEALYAIGIIGALLLLCVAVSCSLRFGNIGTAMSALCVIALFTFIWQLAAYQWLTALFIGLLNKEK